MVSSLSLVVKYSFAATLFAGYVTAQSTASPPAPTTAAGIPACVLACSTQAAQIVGCSGITDITCVCGADFQVAALQCVQANCTAEEQQAAVGLQSSICQNVTSGSTSPPTATASEIASTPGPTGIGTVDGRTTTTLSGAITSSASSIVDSVSSNVVTQTSTTGAATFRAPTNGARGLAPGTWMAAAVGGVIIAQYAI